MIALGAGSEVVMPFLRSVALAHLISPEQFGLAITLALAAGFSEMITDIGLTNSAMRQEHPDRNKSVLPTLHTIMLGRAVLVGAILAAGGIPLAYLFDAPNAAWSFSALGIAAIIRGFHHLEPQRVLRNFVYGPDALSLAVSHIVWTCATVAAAIILDDYRCMLIGIIASAIAYVAVTHLYSRERWSLDWSPQVAREALGYGAPLMPNGLALAATSMGDRFLIGSLLGVAPLAFYNASSTAAFMPKGVVLRLLSAVAMPLFLRQGRDGGVSSRVFDYWTVVLAGASGLYSVAFLLLGPFAIRLVFGATYAPSQELVTVIALSVYMKYMITLPAPLALVFGQTTFILATSLMSAVALACGALAAWFDPRLEIFVLGLALGEFVAVLLVLMQTIRIYRLAPMLAWVVTLVPVLILCGAHLASQHVAIADIPMRIGLFVSAAAIQAVGYWAAMSLTQLPLVPAFLHADEKGREPVQAPSSPVA
jgi:PST family polysaccharide transporter